MSGEAVAALWAVMILLAWSGVCWSAGAIYDYKRRGKR
jgi:hypothetical protein